MSPDPSWVFRHTVTTPSGISITAIITVPPVAANEDSRELSEIAQMAANHGAGFVEKVAQRRRDAEEMPF